MENQNNEDPGWKQHFPTYIFKERDIALEEYKFATKTLEAEERVFLNAANLSVIVGAALGSLALGNMEKLASAFSPVVPGVATLSLILFLVYGFGALSLRYFADRQKAIVFAARKVIVLRRMLGMNYGSLQLVLPNWRVEGADEPFSIRLFPGWGTYATYPCYAISGISSAVAFFLLATLSKQMEKDGATYVCVEICSLIIIAILWFVSLAFIYRLALLDTHERFALLFARKVAKVLRVSLIGNFEYIIYRSTLAKHEMHRLGINISSTKKVLVHVEDKEFYAHRGVSLRGIGRIVMYVLGLGRRSGGSTITQQLVRTLFIVDQTKLVRRKIVEIILARWFDRAFSKSDQLEMYLSSVRFENGVFGLPAAMRHFFGAVKKSPSPAEAFFLIERVSNIRSGLLIKKIDQTLHAAINAGVLTTADAQQAVRLYRTAVREGKIVSSSENGRLMKAWLGANCD